MEVYHDETQDFVFPLKAKSELDNNTLEGVTARLAPDSAAFSCPPIAGSSGNDGGGALRLTDNNGDGEPADTLMLVDDIAQQMLGEGADIPDDDGDEGVLHDDGVDDGHEPPQQQLPETAKPKPVPQPITLYGRTFAGRDKFNYPIDEVRFRIRSDTKRPPGMGPHTWALLDPAAKAEEIQKWKKESVDRQTARSSGEV